MKKFALLCAALFVLSGCTGNTETGSPSPEGSSPGPVSSQPLVSTTPAVPDSPAPEVTPTPTPTPSLPAEPTPTLAPTDTSGGWDGDLGTLTLADFPTALSDGAAVAQGTEPLYLVAQLPEADTWLYGLNPAKANTLILRVGEKWEHFDLNWLTPGVILPRMAYGDFDADMDLELALILYVGSGTGLSVEELHIIEFGDSGVWTDNYFAPDDYRAILDQSVEYLYDEPSRTLTVQAEGGSVSYAVPEEQTYTGPCGFGAVVSFLTEGDALGAVFGAAYIPNASPGNSQYIAQIQADVVYTGAAFGLANLQAVPYD